LAGKLSENIVEKGTVIYNGIRHERFKEKYTFDYSNPYIFAFGRFVYKKGFDLLIKAFQKVNSNQDVHLIIAGDGPEKNDLEALAKQKGIADKVYFYGKADPYEVVKLIQNSLLGVVPSRQEPFGIAALEVMACGKLVVATNVGGLPEFVQPPHILVEPTIEGIKKGLEAGIEKANNVELDGEKVQKEFDWTNSLNKYEKVLIGSNNG
jgi:glycosyltransferase involved in cell wall biosynthesis